MSALLTYQLEQHPYQNATTCSWRDVNDETVDHQQLDGRHFFQMVEVGTEIPRWDHHEATWMQAEPWLILTRNFCTVLYQMGAHRGAFNLASVVPVECT